MSISLPFASLISYFIYLISPTLINNNLEAQVLEAISNDNYQFIETKLDNYIIDPNAKINGKTLLIHACIYDKPEMVLLLLNKGASLNLPCDNGFTPEEHARINNSIYALAQIIIIKA